MEILTKALTKEGKTVGTIKHIHDKRFTLDVPGKDTWRHARAGASQVVMIAPREIAIIRKQVTSTIALDDILEDFEESHFDYVMVEGFHSSFSGRRDIIRVLCARNGKDARDLLKRHPEGVAFITGMVARRSLGDRAAISISLGNALVIRLPRDIALALSLLTRRPGETRCS